MIIEMEVIAKKYARAFIQAHPTAISEETIEQCYKLIAFLRKHQSIIRTLSNTTLSLTQKATFLERLLIALTLSGHFKDLIMLLNHHKRLPCLEAVVKNIIKEYHKKNKIIVFHITSSHTLLDDEKQRILDFIHHEVPLHTVQATFTIQPLLISGIRITSNTMLWERSIAKFLHQTKQTLLQRVEL